RCGVVITRTALIKDTKPVVRGPIVGAHSNCLLEGLFGGVQLAEPLVCRSEAAMGSIVRRLQLNSLTIFVDGPLVIAGAAKYSTQADMSRRKRAVPLSAPATILLRCVYPFFVMR